MKKHLLLSIIAAALLQCKSSQPGKDQVSLENTHWRLSEINGNPIQTPEGSRDAHFILTSAGGEKKLTGFAGCNSMGGSYTLSGNEIKFMIYSTKMMCPSEQMVIEDFLMKVLTSATEYKINGDVLELLDGQTSLADFIASAAK